MSVVNKMLKDLEQRDKQSVYEADYVPIESQSTSSRKFLVGVAVLAIVVGAISWLVMPKQSVAEKTFPTIKVPSNLTILPTNESTVDGAEQLLEDIPDSLQKEIVLSELDQATLTSLESAKQASAATAIAQAKLAEVNRELDQQAQMPSEKPVFNVTSSNKSASTHRMFEQRIQLSLKNGDTAAALKDLSSLIALEPRNASARKRLASLEFAQGNPKRAAFLLEQGIKLSPNDSSMRLMLARLLFRENRNAQALSLLNEHPKSVITDNELLRFRAALAEKQKDYATSLQDYAVLLQRQPGNARWMLGLAISQDKQKMHEEAVITYRKVKSSNQLSTQVVSFVDGRLAALAGS